LVALRSENPGFIKDNDNDEEKLCLLCKRHRPVFAINNDD
jgi:hypothetical protein